MGGLGPRSAALMTLILPPRRDSNLTRRLADIVWRWDSPDATFV